MKVLWILLVSFVCYSTFAQSNVDCDQLWNVLQKFKTTSTENPFDNALKTHEDFDEVLTAYKNFSYKVDAGKAAAEFKSNQTKDALISYLKTTRESLCSYSELVTARMLIDFIKRNPNKIDQKNATDAIFARLEYYNPTYSGVVFQATIAKDIFKIYGDAEKVDELGRIFTEAKLDTVFSDRDQLPLVNKYGKKLELKWFILPSTSKKALTAFAGEIDDTKSLHDSIMKVLKEPTKTKCN